MSTANLNRENIVIEDGLDSIVIVQAVSQIPGGRTLNVSELPEGTAAVKSGHVLVIDPATKEVYPLNITDGAYVSISGGRKYYGVLKCTVPTRDPRAAIVTAGQINEAASPAPVTDEIKTALPRLEWLYGK